MIAEKQEKHQPMPKVTETPGAAVKKQQQPQQKPQNGANNNNEVVWCHRYGIAFMDVDNGKNTPMTDKPIVVLIARITDERRKQSPELTIGMRVMTVCGNKVCRGGSASSSHIVRDLEEHNISEQQYPMIVLQDRVTGKRRRVRKTFIKLQQHKSYSYGNLQLAKSSPDVRCP